MTMGNTPPQGYPDHCSLCAARAKEAGLADCNHGVVFDTDEAERLLSGWEASNPAEFIAGNPASAEVRRRWPRLQGQCPKGCGYNGIAYASYEHLIAGDW